jgi:hypothetical protein
MNKYKCRGVILRKLDRIEHKCDKILSEILIIRHNQSSDVDILIERMRYQASEMRRQCKTENKTLKRMLGI